MSEVINIGSGIPEEEMKQHEAILNLVPRPTPKPEFVDEQEGYWIVPNAWKMREYKRWLEASKSADIDTMNKLMCMIIKKWPFGELVNMEEFDNLTIEDWRAVIEVVGKTITKTFQRTT